MKTKLDLAHDFAMKHTANKDSALDTIEKIVNFAWGYADAMYSELEKRESKEKEEKRSKFRELLNSDNTFIEREGQHFDDVANIQKTYSSNKEWQPDWSQAPEWAIAWTRDRTGAYWWDLKPIKGIDMWVYGQMYYAREEAPSFGYTGDWKDSLRERPND